MPSNIIRSRKLLDAANGKSCVNCGTRDGTVVAAHLTGYRAHQYGKGRGIKPHDICTADLCMKCHAAFDKYKASEFDASNPDESFMAKIDQSEQFLHCILLTIIRRIDEGEIKLP